MKSLLSREVLICIIFIVVWFAAIALLAYPLADKSVIRFLLMFMMPLPATVFGVVSKVPFLRFQFHKLRYRYFGPTYQVQAGGTFRTVASERDTALLKIGLRTAQQVYGTARAESCLSNSIMIRAANSRTIRLDLHQEFDDKDEDDPDIILADNYAEVCRSVEVELWGYEANSNRITQLVENEIVPFFDKLPKSMKAKTTGHNFWLKIILPSRNPFLQFYLKDVPDADVSKFQLEFTLDMAGDKARVAIQEEGFSISAFTPRPFTKLVRTYLSTPALANGDRN